MSDILYKDSLSVVQYVYKLEVAAMKNDNEVVDTLILSGGIVAERNLSPQIIFLGRWVKSRELSFIDLLVDER